MAFTIPSNNDASVPGSGPDPELSTDVESVVEESDRMVLVDESVTLWAGCATLLRTQVSDGVWHSTFQQVHPVAAEGKVLRLGVPNHLVKERIENRYIELLRGVLTDMGTSVDEIDIIILDPAIAKVLGSTSIESLDDVVIDITDDKRDIQMGRPPASMSGTDPRYTFGSFVQGTSNRFAHAAALAVAERPARSYNPLFIYGGAGLGKTHLLQAIANYVLETYTSSRISYVSTETFLNEFVESIRRNTQPEFKRRYREIDVLLVDDIQFMEGKEGLQEEFFHTFNSLHHANRQIVLSSDRPPDSISTLEERLRSRFKQGLITDIQPPDLETRLAILRKKAERDTQQVPHDVLEYIATHITNNIRELEGALIRINAFASLTNVDITIELAAQVLSDVLTEAEPRPITPTLILECTSEMFDFTIDEITGKSRRRPLVAARQIAMYVTRELTDLSYPAIAREFGGRDHTTIIHACDKIRQQISERRAIYDQVTTLTQRVKQ